MKGIIIAGGLGTRLRPLTYRRPKPLVPVVNRPFLEYQVALLKAHGVDDIAFATNYMAEMIESHFGDGSRFGVQMQYALEDTPLGTGGAIRNAADLFPGETVVVFNGDVLTEIDLGAVIRFHQATGAAATITLTPVERPHPFGVLNLDDAGRVMSWREPTEDEKRALASGVSAHDEGTDLINAGFYVLSAEAVASIPQARPSSIERDIFPKLISKGSVYGTAPTGFWMDVGRPQQLLDATYALLEGRVKSSLPLSSPGKGTHIAAGASVDARTSIGSDCEVEDGSRVEGSLLLDGVRVGRGAVVRNAILDAGVIVEAGAEIDGDEVQVVETGTVVRRASSSL